MRGKGGVGPYLGTNCTLLGQLGFAKVLVKLRG